MNKRHYYQGLWTFVLVYFSCLFSGQLQANNSFETLGEISSEITLAKNTNTFSPLNEETIGHTDFFSSKKIIGKLPISFLQNTAMFTNCTCKDSEGIIFRYTGESCSASNNSQDSGKTSCSGSPGGNGVNISYDGGSIQDVNIGDVVFIGGPDNDLSSETDIQVGGQAIVLHTSCSQPLNVGDQFGSLEVVGFIFKNGSICGVEPCSPCDDGGEIGDDEAQCDPFNPEIITEITAPDCPVAPPTNSSCDCKDSEYIIFTYTGGSCGDSNNSQPNDKWECSGSFNGAASVNVQFKDGSVNVALGESFQVERDDAKEITISGGGGSQTMELHVSCSQPLIVGESFGALTIAGFIYKDGTRCGPSDETEDDLEYQWISSTTGCPDDVTTQSIPGATGKEYDPPTINQTTWYARMTRKKDCIPADQFNQFPNSSCGCKDSEYIIFTYTGGSCGESNNSQPNDKWECSGSFNGAASVNVQYKDGSVNVALGESFQVERDDAKEITISGGGRSQTMELHVSCSQPLILGESFGALTIAGFIYKDGTRCEIPDEEPPGEENPWVASNCVVKRVDNISFEILNKVCNINNPSSSFDDTYTFDLVVNGNGASGFWNADISNPFLGAFQTGPQPYGTTINLGPFPAGTFSPSNVSPPVILEGGLAIDITVRDVDNPTCEERTTVQPPDCVNPLATYGDMVFEDLDKDGIMDNGEPGVQGVFVTLSKLDGTVIGTKITDSNGKYLFTDLVPNMQYKATFLNIPNGFQFTTPNVGDDAADSDVNPATGMTEFTTLDPEEDDRTWDAGIVSIPPPPSCVGDFVWLDEDKDGIQDFGESGIDGVTVKLLDSNNNILQTTITADGGKYKFTTPPGDYKVMFNPPPSLIPCPQTGSAEMGKNDDNDANPATGMTEIFSLDEGENNTTIDACFRTPEIPPACIGDFVWLDEDNDGIQDFGESGIDGVTVKLLDNNNNILQTTITADGGKYKFTTPPGDYKVMFNPPPSFIPCPQTGSAGTGNNNDNDANPATGMTEVFSVDQGENNITIDACFRTPEIPPACIGDFVWSDEDNDGIQDFGESGIDGVTVKLLDSNNNILQTTTTADGGKYKFTTPPGNYKVMFNPPPSFIPCPQTGSAGTGNNNDNDANPATGMTEVFSVDAGENNITIDACFKPTDKCDNVNFGGKIGFGGVCSGSYEICGYSGEAPVIRDCNSPSGGSGDLEVIWLKNEISCEGPTGTVEQMLANPSAYKWKIIPGATSLTYTPGVLSTSTCFLRCTRRAGCDRYLGESNIVQVTVNPNCGNNGGTNTETCEETTITYGNGKIEMKGAANKEYFFQIFDANWNTVFSCGWDCGNIKSVSN